MPLSEALSLEPGAFVPCESNHAAMPFSQDRNPELPPADRPFFPLADPAGRRCGYSGYCVDLVVGFA